MDRDGTRDGFDIELTRAVSDAVSVPVIASGGVGSSRASRRRDTRRTCRRGARGKRVPLRDFTVRDAKLHMQAQGIEVRL
jgi:cyclase